MDSKNIFTISRRDLLKQTILLSARVASLILPLIAQSGRAEANPKTYNVIATPPLGEGPFYPIKNRADKDNDLTLIKGYTERAEGQVIYLYGRVTDGQCRPIPDAMVEIWQANAKGRYDHIEAPNVADLDPNFQYWGYFKTDAQGRYEFITIMPGAYPAWGDWVRPPHIHFHVYKSGFHDLTTQMFFAEEPLNMQDRVLQQLPPEQQPTVVATLENPVTNNDKSLPGGYKRCKFNIVLRGSPI